MSKMYFNLLYLVQSKCIKMHEQEILNIARNSRIELFCVSLYTDYLIHLHKKLQVLPAYDANVECQI